MRVGYLGPEGTFSHEAALAAPSSDDDELVALPTLHDVVMAVQDRAVDRALAPIENSIEGSVNAVLDPLAAEASDVVMVGETVLAIRYALVAREPLALTDVETVLSHPQGNAQCARFLRAELAHARVLPATSTAEALRTVLASEEPAAALATRAAAARYGGVVVLDGIADEDNETRFVWLAPEGTETAGADAAAPRGWKTTLVFWGLGAESPGWLARCLSELALRGVNLTRIESRPRREGLGRYMFFVDLEGRREDRPVVDAVAALRGHTEALRVLGSYPAA